MSTIVTVLLGLVLIAAGFLGVSIYLLVAAQGSSGQARARSAAVAGLALLLIALLLDSYCGHMESLRDRPAPRQWEATVYLPLADNQGRPFVEADWQAALERLVTPFGGATLGQPQEGCWLDDRRRMCREPIRPVVVSFAPGRLEEFRRAVHRAGQHLGQQAMYVRYEEPRVQLIAVSP